MSLTFPFEECGTCLNRLYEPSLCMGCRRANHYEGEPEEQEVEQPVQIETEVKEEEEQ